jgi:hypothetical protein
MWDGSTLRGRLIEEGGGAVIDDEKTPEIPAMDHCLPGKKGFTGSVCRAKSLLQNE